MPSETTALDTASTDSDGSLDFTDLVRDAVDRLGDSAHVERVYGDPVPVGDRRVVPVARVAYLLGRRVGRR